MKKILKNACVIAVAAVLLSSCIGSFKMTKTLHSWNSSFPKPVSEVIFLALNIVPVYSFTVFADAVVLNSIEFWTGSNPMAALPSKTIHGEKGDYLVKQTPAGYQIIHEQSQEVMDLKFDQSTQTWSASVDGLTYSLVNTSSGTPILNIR